jgi:RNA recognition motif-containing protein
MKADVCLNLTFFHPLSNDQLVSSSPLFLFADDVRLFIGNLGNEVNDNTLTEVFSAYPSFVKARVVRDKRTGKTKAFGFASFLDPNDAMKAFRDKHGMRQVMSQTVSECASSKLVIQALCLLKSFFSNSRRLESLCSACLFEFRAFTLKFTH